MAARTDVTFTSGGTTCAGWLYRPDDADGDVPCVVMAPGFSATRYERLPAYAERFAAAGFAALVFDYRYFGDSAGEPRQLISIARQHEDYRAAIAYARSLDGIDAERIVLWGSSFSGGHVVQVGASDGRVKAIVSQAPFTNGLATLKVNSLKNIVLGTLFGLADAIRGRRGKAVYMEAVAPPGAVAAMTAPEAEPGFTSLVADGSKWENRFTARTMLTLAQYAPDRFAADLHCPLLVCVCDKDQTTPPAPADAMASRAPQGEVRHYDVGHFEIYLPPTFDETIEHQLEFLRRVVPGVGAEAEQSANAPDIVTT